MTNREIIASELRSGRKLTRSIAASELNIYNLPNIVSHLRKIGYVIHGRSVGTVNSVGDHVTVSEYWIDDVKKGPREWVKSGMSEIPTGH